MIGFPGLRHPYSMVILLSMMALNLIYKQPRADNTPTTPSASIIIPEQATWNNPLVSASQVDKNEPIWPLINEHTAHTPTFLEKALEKPTLYFSQDNEAASQRRAAENLATMAKSGEWEAAWKSCLRLRWLSPRIDLVAPVCREIGDSRLKATSKLPTPPLQDLLPAQAPRFELIVSRTLAKLADDYLEHPYDPSRLATLVISLDNSGRRDLARRLLPELYQLDNQCLWLKAAPWGLNGPLVNIAREPPR
jgi:hypothetical protein